ncbi:MAG TPA: enoyl-CoA hydratase/isomerase family protein [Pseudonocardiaceae bacterium]|nr:enoyl-CoA hydratase/isomerase family protein [Pseudonocardiaceae bacterium]
MSDEAIYERRGDAGWITLNRPAKRNAMTPAMIADLHAAMDQAGQDDAVRSLVITGAGTAFCAGADLDYFQSQLDSPDGLDRFMAELLRPLTVFLARLRGSARPVIAAVNGPCAAGGFELLMCCDLVIAGTTATFSDAHARLGLAPAVGGVAGLVRSVGANQAKRFLLTADSFDAATMAAAGLVTEVVEPAALVPRVTELTSTFARRSPRSLALLKAMVHRNRPDWARLVEADLADFRAGWHTAELREGIRAYTERRSPRF